ncbi:hypothetical protein GCM10011579_068340 [Streptomyces albiflavescens]|uniref:Uncharacterized protein n=1 Tax=Streptomyces albiflavescens TaxID=1623582 RepID=A0A917YC36_9ACTN|nr:hypothetical protein GCM10011579_068340 [Streptomyces albiflavescens]
MPSTDANSGFLKRSHGARQVIGRGEGGEESLTNRADPLHLALVFGIDEKTAIRRRPRYWWARVFNCREYCCRESLQSLCVLGRRKGARSALCATRVLAVEG